MESKQYKIQALMAERGLDGILASSPENFHYITGFASHQHTVSRQPSFACALLPLSATQQTHILVMDFEEPALAKKLHQTYVGRKNPFFLRKYDTWVGVREWEEIRSNCEICREETFHTFWSRLSESMEALGLIGKTVGLELDFLPQSFYTTLTKQFPSTSFVNVSDLFILSKSVKTPEEVQMFRTLTRVADEALLHASQFVQVGNSERQVAAAFREYVTASGLCIPSAWSTFNTGENSSCLCLPSERIIAEGDVFKFDGGVNAEFDFYTTDTSRSWIIGKGDPRLVELKDRLCEAQRKMIAAAKPGLPINELFHIGYESVKEHFSCYRRGHLGHNISMGPQTAEAPFINATETRPLEAGMILAMEVPCYINGLGGFNIEDMVLITESGSEVLTYRTPHYLP